MILYPARWILWLPALMAIAGGLHEIQLHNFWPGTVLFAIGMWTMFVLSTGRSILPRSLKAVVLIIFVAYFLQAFVHTAFGRSQIPPQDERTATWYAKTPAVAREVLAACIDDPGHARDNSDCYNAEQGLLNDSATKATANLHRFYPESDVRFWQNDWQHTVTVLKFCSKMTPAQKSQYGNCGIAREALRP